MRSVMLSRARPPCGGGGAARGARAARQTYPARVLLTYAVNHPQAQARNAAFLQGLQQLAWTVGNNVQIDRWSGGNEDDTRRYAAELVALTRDVIFTSGSAAVGPLQRATRSVRIVFAKVSDPVGRGSSLAWHGRRQH